MVRNPARLLAPLAILAVAVALFLIVDGNVHSHRRDSATRTVDAPVRRARHRRTGQRSSRPTGYVVRSGDSLSAIADRTGVSLARLEALNPSVGSGTTLHVGERLRLRR